MSEKIVSFDIGIKNMAYCVFEHSREPGICKILDWNVVNLMNEEEINRPIVKCTMIGKNKKLCNRLAKYTKGELCYCDKHAKLCEFQLPTKESSPTYLKKRNLQELCSIAVKCNLLLTNEKKPQILAKIQQHYDTVLLSPIVTVKKTANEHSLIDIGKSIKREFQKIVSIKDIQKVLIENQISPLASRMSSIQGLVTQYFIMENEDIDIEFISSKNKLKLFSKSTVEATEMVTTVNEKYKQHKKDGILFAKQIISKNELFQSWLHALDTKKKDDLADCFLQGIWYMNDRNLWKT
jgi:hypothetical protein